MKKEILELIEKKYDKEDLKYHIIPVVKNAFLLAEKVGADKDVVEMGAYMHDAGRAIKRKDLEGFEKENEHHIIGEKITREFLESKGYDKEFIDKVAHCVLAHRGRREPNPETLEAEVVACADAMAHIVVFLDLFPVFLRTCDSFEEAIVEIEKKMERNWNKKLTLPEAREIVKEKYNAIMLLINSMKEYM
jgi:uncharacterized protein